jgi:hypothetical protein
MSCPRTSPPAQAVGRARVEDVGERRRERGAVAHVVRLTCAEVDDHRAGDGDGGLMDVGQREGTCEVVDRDGEVEAVGGDVVDQDGAARRGGRAAIGFLGGVDRGVETHDSGVGGNEGQRGPE